MECFDRRKTPTVSGRIKRSARQSVQSIGVSPVCPRAPASIVEGAGEIDRSPTVNVVRNSAISVFEMSELLSRAGGRWILIRDRIPLANRSLRQTKSSPLCPGLGSVAVGAKKRTQAGRLCYQRLGVMPAT